MNINRKSKFRFSLFYYILALTLILDKLKMVTTKPLLESLKDIDKELINHCLVNNTFMDTISKYGTTEYVKVLEDLNERI